MRRNKPQLDLKDWLRNNWLSLLLLTLFVFIAYVNSLGNAFVSDDIGAIYHNRGIGTVRYITAQPTVFIQQLLYSVVYRISGLSPAAFRLINVVFHLGSVWLVYTIIRRLTNQTVAFLAASIFAVHPILTESVTWISGGNYVRYSFFFLSSFLAYLIARASGGRGWYAASFSFFVFSLFSSEKALVLPVVFLLYEFVFKGGGKYWRRILPYFMISIFWAGFYISQIGRRVSEVEAQSSGGVGLYNPLIQIPVAITSYLRLLMWPDKLTFYHSELAFTQSQYAIILVGFVLFVALLLYSFQVSKMIFFWLSFFVVTLAPTITPLRIAWVVAERYVYLGSIGVIFTIAYGLYVLSRKRKLQAFVYMMFVVIATGFLGRTILRNFDWKNQDTLWLATAKTSPSSSRNHNNLGDLYARRGDLKQAVREFKAAIRLNPRYADAYHNLANTYQNMGKTEEALENYQKALSLNSSLWQSHQNIAAIYFEEGEYDQARTSVERAIKINPKKADLHTNLGIVYLRLGNKLSAEKEFKRALKLDPDDQKARLGLVEIDK